MRRIFLVLIRGYQIAVSPLFPPSCRFIPSCSEYARQAFEQHGLAKGMLLTTWRLLRCQPLCVGGLDPVPDTWPAKRPSMLPEPPSCTANFNQPNS